MHKEGYRVQMMKELRNTSMVNILKKALCVFSAHFPPPGSVNWQRAKQMNDIVEGLGTNCFEAVVMD